MKNHLFFYFLPLYIFLLSSCGTGKFYKQQEAVKSGLNLDKIKESNLDHFVSIWSENKRNLKFDTNIKMLYSDGVYSYFTKPKIGLFNPKNDFFKIQNHCCPIKLFEKAGFPQRLSRF